MEDQGQFFVGERFARQPAVKNRHADQRLPVQNGNGHLSAEQFKFLLNLTVVTRSLTVALQNPALAMDVAADACFERQLEMLQQTGRQSQRAGRTEPAILLAAADNTKNTRLLAQKNHGPVHADDFPQ